MDFRKLDARLSEALSQTDERAEYEVFVEVAPDLAPDERRRLEQLGVCHPGQQETIVTARLRRGDLDAVSQLRGVRQVRLGRRLRQA